MYIYFGQIICISKSNLFNFYLGKSFTCLLVVTHEYPILGLYFLFEERFVYSYLLFTESVELLTYTFTRRKVCMLLLVVHKERFACFYLLCTVSIEPLTNTFIQGRSWLLFGVHRYCQTLASTFNWERS